MHTKEYVSILSPQNGMNLYRGCTHGCIYCDSRSLCYQMNHDFEDIEVKINAIELLESQLRRKRKKAMISSGSMCDPYMPIEETWNLTRKSLELIEKYGFGATLITKSARVMRDFELIQRIHAKTKFVLQMTLTTYDEDLCKIVEPRVSTTQERVEVLKRFRDAGIPTVVWFSPILPWINDTEENIRGILNLCLEAGVKGILYFGAGLTLRDGDREYYYKQLDRHFPGLKQRYEKMYGNDYILPSPNSASLDQIVTTFCQEHGIMIHPDEVFSYLKTFEDKMQLTLF